DAVPVALDGGRSIDEKDKLAVSGPEIQFLQETSPVLHRRLVVEVLECQTDLVGTCGLEMARWEPLERCPLPCRQVGRIAQPDVARAAQQALALLLGAPHLLDGVV